MGETFWFVQFAGMAILSPGVLAAIIGLSNLFSLRLSEQLISRIAMFANFVGLMGSLGVAVLMIVVGQAERVWEIGDWVAIPNEHFYFHLKFVFDRLSLPLVILTYVLCGTVAAFASNYLHRESGFQRFFLYYAIFSFGLTTSFLAGTIEVLFFGWELVGLASALLVGFFHERRAPVENGLRIWAIYRLADAFFLIAAVIMHNVTGHGDFDHLTGAGAWPYATSVVKEWEALSVGLLLVLAAAGKSALVPFSGWLPRAMEGPTPSSAIFYGALSIHLGAFLLLRAAPIIAASTALTVLVIVLGLATSIFANMAGRVQADIKSVLAFASLTQVGLIITEIGMGWYYLALFHIIGHALLRTLQLLRASNLLHDYFKLETALGKKIAHLSSSATDTKKPSLIQQSWYRFGLERGYLDTMLDRTFVNPFSSFFQWCSRLESNWIAWTSEKLSGVSRSKDGQNDA